MHRMWAINDLSKRLHGDSHSDVIANKVWACIGTSSFTRVGDYMLTIMKYHILDAYYYWVICDDLNDSLRVATNLRKAIDIFTSIYHTINEEPRLLLGSPKSTPTTICSCNKCKKSLILEFPHNIHPKMYSQIICEECYDEEIRDIPFNTGFKFTFN